jgi:hypothetical protein
MRGRLAAPRLTAAPTKRGPSPPRRGFSLGSWRPGAGSSPLSPCRPWLCLPDLASVFSLGASGRSTSSRTTRARDPRARAGPHDPRVAAVAVAEARARCRKASYHPVSAPCCGPAGRVEAVARPASPSGPQAAHRLAWPVGMMRSWRRAPRGDS